MHFMIYLVIFFIWVLVFFPSDIFADMNKLKTKYDNNLVLVTWDHAVNSKYDLAKSLSSKVDCIETDLFYNNVTNVTYHCHPPDTQSDLTFDSFVKIIKHKEKLFKLDFKNTGAFINSVDNIGNIPKDQLILNADLIACSYYDNVIVDADQFFKLHSFVRSHISIGWTVQNNGFGYTWNDVYKMYQLLKTSQTENSTFHTTVAVSVQMMSCNSVAKILWLIKVMSAFTEFSVTIWSFRRSEFSLDVLKKIRPLVNKDNLMVDIPQMTKLELSQLLNVTADSWRPNFLIPVSTDSESVFITERSILVAHRAFLSFKTNMANLDFYLSLNSELGSNYHSNVSIKVNKTNEILYQESYTFKSNYNMTEDRMWIESKRVDSQVEKVFHFVIKSTELFVEKVFNYNTCKPIFQPYKSITLSSSSDESIEIEFSVGDSSNRGSFSVLELVKDNTGFSFDEKQ